MYTITAKRLSLLKTIQKSAYCHLMLKVKERPSYSTIPSLDCSKDHVYCTCICIPQVKKLFKSIYNRDNVYVTIMCTLISPTDLSNVK